MSSSLTVLAGTQALRIVRERGLRADDIDVIVGASGGPKWLVLAGLDRYLFGEFHFADRNRPLHLIGSSIGSWRMAGLALQDPLAALARGQEATLSQRYPPKPSPELVTATSAGMLDLLLGESGEAEILQNPWARLHVLVTEFHGPLASGRRTLLASGLALAAMGNLVARRSLGLQMRRAVFHNAGESSPFLNLSGFDTRYRPLTAATLKPALLASGSVPLLMNTVRMPDVGGAIFMDGGFIDYHPDLNFGNGEGMVLYPHFFPYVIPGWFDKTLPWRRSSYANFSRVLLISPSPEFVRTLPYGRIPDRSDFTRLSDDDRLRYWRQVVGASQRLGDELNELCANGRLADHVQAFPAPVT